MEGVTTTQQIYTHADEVAQAAGRAAGPGSGAIEGGIKAIVVQRANQSGMYWTTSGAASIIALRCQHASGRWDELWPGPAARPAALHAAI
jgi:hypothetical protein